MPTDQRETPATMGLLPFLSAHALDEDYANAARSAGPAPQRHGGWTILVLAAFVVLLMTAATQTSKNAVADQGERNDLVKQIDQRKRAVNEDTAQMERLQADNIRLRALLVDNDKLSSGTRAQLALLRVRSGTDAVQGPGVSVTVDNALHSQGDRSTVLDSDLQQLVNGLWSAGAEAIAINGERLTNLSSIRQAGSAITVNLTSLDRPYVVQAIGDPATLPNRFADTSGGAAWLDLQQQVGLQFSMRTRTRMSLPGAPTPTLRFATSLRKGTS